MRHIRQPVDRVHTGMSTPTEFVQRVIDVVMHDRNQDLLAELGTPGIHSPSRAQRMSAQSPYPSFASGTTQPSASWIAPDLLEVRHSSRWSTELS